MKRFKKIINKTKDLINKIRIYNLKRKGYQYYTITENGVITSMIFYKGV